MKVLSKINQWFGNIGTYRLTIDRVSFKYTAFIVEVQGLVSWHIVKTFIHEDEEYAHLCAKELLESLREKI